MITPDGLKNIPSPGLIFAAGAIDRNLQRMLDQVDRDPSRLRPHIKTHKCGAVLRRMKDLGISSVKCATLAEADLAAEQGFPDILIAYPLIGPDVFRLGILIDRWPASRFSVIIDSAESLEQLEAALLPSGLDAYLDLDVGMHRTGISREHGAVELAKAILTSPRLNFVGVHAYDGHIHTSEPVTRRKEFEQSIRELDLFLDELADDEIDVSRLVAGGTPTFPFHAERAADSPIPWQCSPGTPVLWDAGYGEHFPDLAYEPAAFLITRVVSHPGPGLACLDLGHKSVSAENPITHRVRFPDLPEAEFVSQSEEHLVIKLPEEKRPVIGETLLGIPYHVCPTVALYDEATILREGKISAESWPIEARKREI